MATAGDSAPITCRPTYFPPTASARGDLIRRVTTVAMGTMKIVDQLGGLPEDPLAHNLALVTARVMPPAVPDPAPTESRLSVRW